MKKLLEDLWYSYEMQNGVEQNEEQKSRLEKFGDRIDDLHDIAECEAFIRGVRFATAFLTEALVKG